MTENLLSISPYHRSGAIRPETRAVVMHWVANPGTSPAGNRNYWELLNGPDVWASAHYIIGIEGDALRAIPENEVAFHAGSGRFDPGSKKIYTDKARELFGASYTTGKGTPNHCTIGIELCHRDWSGMFSEKTLDAASALVADICTRYTLDPMRDVITHHEVVGWKDCPRYWTVMPEQFLYFKRRVGAIMSGGKIVYG